jgi:WD40 repeat protein
MRRRDFIKAIGGAAAGWRPMLRGGLGVAALGAQSPRVNAQPAAAPSAANLPVEIVPTVGHSSEITSAAFAPDGRTIISASTDKTLKLWAVADGRELRTFKGDQGFTAVAFAPDGSTVVSGGSDKALQFWDVASGSELRTLTGHDKPINAVAYAPDGRTVVSGSDDKTLKLWEVESGRELRTFTGHEQGVLAVAFSPDGKTIVSGSYDKTLKLWDAATGNVLRTLTGHTYQVTAVAYSPDGRTIVSGSYDQTLSLWDAESGQELHILRGHKVGDLWPAINCAAFSPDSRTVVSGGMDKALRLWDVATGRELRILTPDDGDQIRAVAFSPDGRLVLCADNNAVMKLWDAASGRELRALARHGAQVLCLAYSPDGRLIASGNLDDSLRLWDAASGRELRTLEGKAELWVAAVAFSPDSRILVSAHYDKTLKLWDTASGRKLRTLTGHTSGLETVAFSPDGRTIASAGEDTMVVKLWDPANGRELRSFERQSNNVYAVAFSPDGRVIVTGGGDSTVKLWDAASGRVLRTLTGHKYVVNAVAFSPDGRTIVSGSDDQTLKLWDAASGSELRTFTGHDNAIHAVAFSPDGRIIASAGDDETVRLWDAADGRELHTLTGHAAWVRAAAFSPDGHSIVSGSWDTTIRRWNLRGELLTTSVASDTEWLTITPEGFFDASDKGANLLTAVRGLEFYSIDQFYQQLYRPDVVRQKLAMDPDINSRVKDAARGVNLDIILASKSPPDITIVSPQANVVIGDDKVTIETKLTEQGGGIGRIEWRMNGVTSGVQDLAHSATRIGDETTVSRTLAVADGASVIELVAYNHANLTASSPVSVLVTVKSYTPRPQPRLHVLAIGINAYRSDALSLRFAVADAKAVSAAFALPNAVAKIYESVVIHPPLLDSAASAQNIGSTLEELGKIIRPEDVFVLYLAGHGVTDNGRYYFVPYDTNYENGDYDELIKSSVDQDRLQEWLTKVTALRSVLIYDTCESGSMTEERSGFRGGRQLVAVEKLSQSTGRTVLTATSDVATAREGYQNHGIFTYVLLQAFALADRNNDGRIDTAELAGYLQTKLPELTEAQLKVRQEPQVKLTGAPFVLMNRADVAQISKLG